MTKKQNSFKNFQYQTGQALLIVLLAMTAVVVIVLSTVSRSVTDIKVTSTEEDSLRAFSAAEAGVEQVLLSQQGLPANTQIGSSGGAESIVNASFGNASTSTNVLYPKKLNSGESATFWITGLNDSGNFSCSAGINCYLQNTLANICWGDTNANPAYTDTTAPAVEVSVYYDSVPGSALSGNFSGVKVVREAYDPIGSRRTLNNFSNPQGVGTDCTGVNFVTGSKNFAYGLRDFSFTNDSSGVLVTGCNPVTTNGCVLVVKVKVIYNVVPVSVGIKGANGRQFPPQGKTIDSFGQAGSATRRVNVFQGHAEPPAVFDSALFTPLNIEKN